MSLQDGLSRHAASSQLELPPVGQLISDLSPYPPSLACGTETVDTEEQKELFQTLQNAIHKAESSGQIDVESLQSVRSILYKLWSCNSLHLIQAADLLANGSRDREFSFPRGF